MIDLPPPPDPDRVERMWVNKVLQQPTSIYYTAEQMRSYGEACALAALEAAALACESDAPYRVEMFDGELTPSAHEGRLRAQRVRALKVMAPRS